MKRQMFVRGLLRLGLAGIVTAGQFASAQASVQAPSATPKPKPKASSTARTPIAKPGVATWSPEVQKTLGVAADNFNAEGLNKLTKVQLMALLISAKPDANSHVLTCPASTLTPGLRIHLLLTVAGDDSSGQIATQIRQAISGLTAVDVVDTPAAADRALHVVIQEQTIGKRTIGFTASYLTSTPCTEVVAGKKSDAELKGTLGTYTDAKGADLARDLAAMLDQDLQPLRGAAAK